MSYHLFFQQHYYCTS